MLMRKSLAITVSGSGVQKKVLIEPGVCVVDLKEKLGLLNYVLSRPDSKQVLADGQAVSDPSRDLLKIAVIERHHNSAKIGKAFVRGLGIKKGALASSVAHDSHNIIVVGTSDADMQAALQAVVEMNGGLAAVADKKPIARLPLPIAGLMSPEPVKKIREHLDQLIKASQSLGSRLKDPYMTLSFLALPVIPELKITDMGLIDVKQFKVVSLFVP